MRVVSGIVVALFITQPLPAATRIWVGGNGPNWTTAANWGGTAPSPGDDLVFPVGVNTANLNDFPALTTFHSISIQGNYTLSGNSIDLDAGGLTVSASSTIQLPISFVAAQLWTINPAATLIMAAPLSGNGNLVKTGSGSLQLSGSTLNSYSGVTVVDDGTLQLNMSGGAIAIPSNLTIGDGIGPGIALVQLVGNNQIASTAAITVNSDGRFDVNGQTQTIGLLTITDGAATTGSGTLTVGSLAMTGGSITLPTAGSSLVLAGDVTATSDPNGSATVLGSGTLSLGGATRTFTISGGSQAHDLTIFSAIAGTGAEGLTKAGNGTLQLQGNNTYTGPTTINAGTLQVDGTIATVSLNGGTLIGTGTTGGIGSTGGTIQPGDGPPSTGVLTTGPALLSSGSTLSTMIRGTTLGTQYDVLNVAGAANLGGGTLNLTLGVGYAPSPGDTYDIVIASGGVSGTFGGLPNGGTVCASGLPFQIAYAPTVVTLTAVASTTTHFVVSTPANATAGSAFSFTVTAVNQCNAPISSYSGTVHFTSSDGTASLPADSTLSGGTGTFSATMNTAGNQTITATDTLSPSITGTSNPIAVSAAAATHFVVSAPASATAGSAFNFTITALDQFNNTATGYAGMVHFTSSDGQAVLPANSTLTNGTGTFSATLKTAGNQTITGTDSVSPAITGTSNSIAVSTAATSHFSISAPGTATAGSAFSFTVTALDAFNNTTTGYAGTVHFTSSDGAATLPANSTLTNGTGTFSATLKTAGNQTITATDTVSPAIAGTSNSISVSAAAATHLLVSAPATATAGSAFNFTVTALDQFNNTATAYAGTVHFSSSDGAATLPADSTLAAGTGTFSATLRTAGNQTITATDTVNTAITGTSNSIAVSAAAATHFVVSAPATATAGSAFSFTVTALDQLNNTATGYSGTVHFTSSDGAATLPANSTLTNGTGTFSATLRTAGNQTITATDTVSPSVTGTSNSIAVSAAATSHFIVSAPAIATAGSPFNFTVTAADAFNNTTTAYAGTVHFTSSDGAATLPANSMLTNGTGTFSATLHTAGNQTITATDTVTASINGNSAAIAVSLTATDVAISKTASPPPYGTGLPITYTIVVSDTGPVSATGVMVTDNIPPGTTFVSATPTQGTCSGTTTVTCNLGTLASGATATISLVLQLPSAPGTVSNTATVTSASPDTNPANNSSTSTVTVVAAASIPALSTLALWMLALSLLLLGAMRLRG